MTDSDATRLVDIERRLARLEDIEALHRLRYRYHELINSNAWEEHAAELFTDDAVMDYEHLKPLAAGTRSRRSSARPPPG